MLVNFLYRIANLGFPIVKRLMPYQVYLYLFTGALNTFLNMLWFAVFVTLLGDYFLSVEVATIIALIVTVYTGFWFSKNFAFKQEEATNIERQNQFKKYVLVAIQGQVSSYLITKVLIVLLSFKPILAYILTAIVMLTTNYFLQKYFSFKQAINK